MMRTDCTIERPAIWIAAAGMIPGKAAKLVQALSCCQPTATAPGRPNLPISGAGPWTAGRLLASARLRHRTRENPCRVIGVAWRRSPRPLWVSGQRRGQRVAVRAHGIHFGRGDHEDATPQGCPTARWIGAFFHETIGRCLDRRISVSGFGRLWSCGGRLEACTGYRAWYVAGGHACRNDARAVEGSRRSLHGES